MPYSPSWYIDRNWSDPIYDNLKNLTGEDLLDLVYEMAPKPSEIFYHVLWVGEYLDVDSALEMVMTDLGLSPVLLVNNDVGLFRAFTGILHMHWSKQCILHITVFYLKLWYWWRQFSESHYYYDRNHWVIIDISMWRRTHHSFAWHTTIQISAFA